MRELTLWDNVAEFKTRNPTPGPYPVWTPMTLPVTRTNGDLEVSLIELVSGTKTVQWLPGQRPFTLARFKVFQNGQPTEAWIPDRITAEIDWSIWVALLETMNSQANGKSRRGQNGSRSRLDWPRCATLNFLRAPKNSSESRKRFSSRACRMTTNLVSSIHLASNCSSLRVSFAGCLSNLHQWLGYKFFNFFRIAMLAEVFEDRQAVLAQR